MRTLHVALIFAALVGTPLAAHAGFVVEASAGRGAMVSPSIEPDVGVTSFQLMPGYGLGEVLRAGIGVVFDAPEGDAPANLRLRPTLTLDPPIFPLYGRLILGVSNLLDGDTNFEYGGAVGVGGSVAGIGLFAEIGVLPETVAEETIWIAEGRAGVMLAF